MAAEEEGALFGKFDENSVLKYGYCSEVLLQLTRHKCDVDAFDLEAMKDFLNSIGDSVAVFKTGYAIKAHVHTFEPHRLLEYCLCFGEFLKVKIENMTLQHSAATVQNRFQPKAGTGKERKKFGVVAVASGEGLKSVFKELGADAVIDGGQTNNPSSGDFLRAFAAVNADIIFVLPNNSNIILAAKQAAKAYEASKVHVIESKSLGEGYAALSMLDLSSGDESKIIEGMYEEIRNTQTGALTSATRAAKCNGFCVEKGDYIGVLGKDVASCGPSLMDAARGLIERMRPEERGYAVVIYGKNFPAGEKEGLTRLLLSKNGGLEIYEIEGGQEIYDAYIILS